MLGLSHLVFEVNDRLAILGHGSTQNLRGVDGRVLGSIDGNAGDGHAGGICTMESRESMPPKSLVFMGTPTTGSGVKAATTPPRCAALPAAATITLMPRSAAVSAHS